MREMLDLWRLCWNTLRGEFRVRLLSLPYITSTRTFTKKIRDKVTQIILVQLATVFCAQVRKSTGRSMRGKQVAMKKKGE